MDGYSKFMLTVIAALLAVLALQAAGIMPKWPGVGNMGAAEKDVPFAVTRDEHGTFCYVLKDGELKMYEIEGEEHEERLALRVVVPLPAASTKPAAPAAPPPSVPEVLPNVPALQTLVDAIATEDQPRPGENGQLDRDIANKRLIEKLKDGLPVEFKAKVGRVSAHTNGVNDSNESFSAEFRLGSASLLTRDGIVGTVRSGGSEWQVRVPEIQWSRMDMESAKKIRDALGKEVTIKAKLTQLLFLMQDGTPTLRVYMNDIIVDGISAKPASMSPF